MTGRERVVLIAMCVVWGLHFAAVKVAFDELAPLTYVAARMTVVALVLSPFLRWRSGAMGPVLAGGVFLGFANYALLFEGLKYAPVSAAAVAIELYTPFAAILSVLVLRERIGLGRSLGVATALAGALIVALAGGGEGGGSRVALGVGLIAVGAAFEAVGALTVKYARAFRPLELLAWFALIGSIGLWPLAVLIDGDVIGRLARADLAVVGPSLLFSAFGASIFGHTAYYWLLHRLPLSQVAPGALLATAIAVAAGVFILREPIGPQLIVGGAMIVAGVAVIMSTPAARTRNRRSVRRAARRTQDALP
ncbi:MAG: DMT family transporter [Pseudomonadota bacterium]